MKKMVLAVMLLHAILCVSMLANAAEYVVQRSDTIGVIAQKTGESVAHLAQLNHISAPKYIVRVGQKLQYVSADDMRCARLWIEEYLASNVHHDEAFEKMLIDIENHHIYYDGDIDTHADSIIVLANAYRKQHK